MNQIKWYQEVTRLYLATIMVISCLLLSQEQANASTSLHSNSQRAIVVHPEVWGYDLSSDNGMIPKGYSLSGLAYKAPDGDIIFDVHRCIENCETLDKRKYEDAMLWFFSGKILSEKDTAEYKKIRELKTYPRDRADLLNGECIKTVHLSTGTMCQENDLAEYLYIKGKCTILDDQNKIMKSGIAANINPEIKRYSIIVAGSKISRYIDKEDGLCDRGGPGGGEIIYKQLYPMESIIGLEDGTFLVLRGDLIIRFDKDFKTKFKPKNNIQLAYEKTIKGNFFVLPYEKIRELVGKVAGVNGHGVQGLHDELLLYLYRRDRGFARNFSNEYLT